MSEHEDFTLETLKKYLCNLNSKARGVDNRLSRAEEDFLEALYGPAPKSEGGDAKESEPPESIRDLVGALRELLDMLSERVDRIHVLIRAPKLQMVSDSHG